ncbi:MAG: PhzF family phenazine biosynthesis protein [Cyanobacteria bacterium]|nr:PhzF family phenazine biosynthesis protein [Cyanobacteriota bacterium]
MSQPTLAQIPASSGPGLPAVLIEAFGAGPCCGNGATVVRLETPAPAPWMGAIAASLRQSETAFVLRAPGERTWLLRWFTPSTEVRLCGHATLGALLALCHWGDLHPGESLRFRTRSGVLPVRLLETGRGQLDLPTGELVPTSVPEPLGRLLLQRLGQPPKAYWTSALGYRVALVAAAAPLAAMASLAHELQGDDREGLVLMQPVDDPGGPLVAGEAADYQLRFFAPGLGIDEDPVTGSAHALVAPYWQKRLQRSRVIGWQCSDRPGGMVCESAPSGMIRLTGMGHLLWDGTLNASVPLSPEGMGNMGDDGEAAWQHWLAIA